MELSTTFKDIFENKNSMKVVQMTKKFYTLMAKSLILCGPNSNQNNYLGFGYKGLVFCRNIG